MIPKQPESFLTEPFVHAQVLQLLPLNEFLDAFRANHPLQIETHLGRNEIIMNFALSFCGQVSNVGLIQIQVCFGWVCLGRVAMGEVHEY